MTEDDARVWLAARYGQDAIAKLEAFCAMLIVGSDQQNLIAPSTVPHIWSRHILDSAQLLDLAPPNWRHWVDIGSGAGLPGLVIAALAERLVTLVEPRRLRVEFLNDCITTLGLTNVTVIQSKAENATIALPVDVVSARAVAKLDALFEGSAHFISKSTSFILPKGQGAKSEVAAARRSWHGTFHVEQSIVEPKSGIVIVTGVTRR